LRPFAAFRPSWVAPESRHSFSGREGSSRQGTN
jgi:hypothetical protein